MELRLKDTRDGREFAGSGVVVDGNRVLTNRHVISGIEDSRFIRADVLVDGTAIPLAPEMINDDRCDLALVSAIRPIARPRVELKFGVIGEPVTAIGNFGGGGLARVQGGVISRRDRQAYFLRLDEGGDCRVLQFSASGIPGGSGGGLYTGDGRLVGLLYARESRAFGIGYAIDAGEIERFLRSH